MPMKPSKRTYQRKRRQMRRPRRMMNQGRLIIPKSLRGINNAVHRFVRYSDQYVELIPSNVALTLVAYQQVFTLNDVSGQAEFTALFDQYRIRAVSVNITPVGQYITNDRTVTGAAGLNTEGTGYWVPPVCYAVIDLNDSNALASVQEAQEYATCKLIPYSKQKTGFYFTPGMNTTVSQSAGQPVNTGTGYARWLNTSNGNVEHYGLKYLVYNPNANNIASSYGTNRWRVVTKYYLEFKNCK